MQATAMTAIFMGLTMSSIFVMLSNNWLLAWLNLEMNTLAILPVISKTKHPRAVEASTKYFLTQTIASCLLLFSCTTNAWYTGTWSITQMDDTYTSTIMLLALTMKAGTVPTHFWLPEVMQGSTLTTTLLMSTWQKIAPMALIYSISNHASPNITLTLGLLSTTFGGWGGMNQTQLRKMMAYSSITNMGWTVMVLTLQPKASMISIIIYIITITPTIFMLELTSTKTLQNMTTSWSTSPTTTTTLALLLLSTAGLPPLTGFIPKLLILNELVTQNLTPTAVAAATASLLSLIFYLRMAYLTALLNAPGSATSAIKWRQKIETKATTLTPTALTAMTILPAMTK
uniref:NADH-ubiquinone oxidoreductase chain 2 n=1 Tax=Diploderma flaviceps TaxID=52218 RepID=A0A384UCH6_9SAUR|nr:NADH dehydrogenase subunit 2 [Diploderma flaviceps]WHS96748.1 NADH dehydrogenase subunit 2 [Diploderma danbaense]ART66042.1 NADH dehydrogenase subunit 2 [Diploderma flaviceps]WHS96749.1 NADH dehydrogenase subunit 2 [Diploderma danbaense]WHS96750.1 NADH dehydrogenase subunit 2 [Diploderma danbaense]WHS96751.1 NADH dehydrogenase subunit 2 [Diploderma danbaense]